MSKRLVFLAISWLLLPKTVMAVEHIFNDDTMGHYTCFEKDTSKPYNRGQQVALEACAEGLDTYRFFVSGKCIEQDVETKGHKYRKIFDSVIPCRRADETYVFQLVPDQIAGIHHRCYEVDEETLGYKYRNQVEISNCENKN